jgi:hypothetical protein
VFLVCRAFQDLDLDLDMDVMVAAANESVITWLENLGAQNFRARIMATTAQVAPAVGRVMMLRHAAHRLSPPLCVALRADAAAPHAEHLRCRCGR